MQNNIIKNLIKFITLNYCNGFITDKHLWRYSYLNLKYDLSIFTYFSDSPSTYNFYSSSVELFYNKELIKIETLSNLLKSRLTNFRYSNKKYYIFDLNKEKLEPIDNLSNMQLITLNSILNKRFKKNTTYFLTLNNISSTFYNFLLNIEKIFKHNNHNYEIILEIIDNLFPAVEIMLDKFYDVKLNLALAFSSNIYNYQKDIIDSFINFIKTLNHIRFDDTYYDLAYNFKNKLIQDEENIFTALIDHINKNIKKKVTVKYSFRQMEYDDQFIIKLINELSSMQLSKIITTNYIIFEDINSLINTKNFILSITLLNNMLDSL